MAWQPAQELPVPATGVDSPDSPLVNEAQVDIIRAATGWEYTVHEAITLGERVENMARVFNIREGITPDQDTLPKRFFSGTRQGALVNTPIDQQALRGAIDTYYSMMGWDDRGRPTQVKLDELGIGWVSEYLS